MKQIGLLIVFLWSSALTIPWSADAQPEKTTGLRETVAFLQDELKRLPCKILKIPIVPGREYNIKRGTVSTESFSLDSEENVHLSNREKMRHGIADWTDLLRTHEFPIYGVSFAYRLAGDADQYTPVQPCYDWAVQCKTTTACVKTFLTSGSKPEIPFYSGSTQILSLGGNEADQRRVKHAFERLIELSGEKLKKNKADK